MRKPTLLALIVGLTLFAGNVAQAGPVTIWNAGPGVVPLGVTYDNLNWFDPTAMYSTQTNAATGVSVTLSPDGKAVIGSVSGEYAAPYIYGANGLPFGDAVGQGLSQYLTSGATAGSGINLTFSAPLKYFGLLWGSIDDYNSLAFYSGGQLLNTIIGTDVDPNANGDQGSAGSFYVNFVADPGFTFDEVRLTSSQYAFEIDNLAFNRQIPVPDGGATLMLLGGALLGLGALRRRIGR